MSKKTASALGKLLNNYFALFAKTLGYHWNVVGCHFLEVHGHLGKMYNSQLETIDEVAERIRMLGFTAPCGLDGLAKEKKIKDGKPGSMWHEMIADLIKDIENVCKVMHEVANIAEKEKDLVTFDMMVKLLADHEKEMWMLKSIVVKNCK